MKFNFSYYPFLIKLLIALQLCATTLHFKTVDFYPFYREVFFVCFLFLFIAYKGVNKALNISFKHPLSIYLFFVLLVFLHSFIPSNIDPKFVELSDSLNATSIQFYIFRNVVLYVPLALALFSISYDFKFVIALGLLTVPLQYISVYFWFQEKLKAPLGIFDFDKISSLSGHGLSYNTYIPMLSLMFVLSVGSAILTNWRLAIIISFLCSPIFFIIYLSTSRSSLLYIILSMLLCSSSFFAKTIPHILNRKKASKWLFVSLLFTTIIISLNISYLSDFSSYSPKLYDRGIIDLFNSEGRGDLFMLYFSKLDISSLFIGNGLNSILFSGPHNGYLRWILRSGLLLAFLAYLPWIIQSFKLVSVVLTVKHGSKTHAPLLLSLVLFVPFYALLGYPTEDAFQSIFCFIALGLSASYLNSSNH